MIATHHSASASARRHVKALYYYIYCAYSTVSWVSRPHTQMDDVLTLCRGRGDSCSAAKRHGVVTDFGRGVDRLWRAPEACPKSVPWCLTLGGDGMYQQSPNNTHLHTHNIPKDITHTKEHPQTNHHLQTITETPAAHGTCRHSRHRQLARPAPKSPPSVNRPLKQQP